MDKDNVVPNWTLYLRLWIGPTVLALVLAATACNALSNPESTLTPDNSTPTLIPTATPTPLPPFLPLSLPPLSTVIPQAAVTCTPLPDEQQVVDAIMGSRDVEHWVAHRFNGSFTAPDANEWVALVGNIGDDDEVRWVVVGKENGEWQLRGT